MNPDGDLLDIQADIIGPGIFLVNLINIDIVGTAYEGGIFKCKVVIDSEFPSKPPKGNNIISFILRE
jgi:ubiquitin-protein ligase